MANQLKGLRPQLGLLLLMAVALGGLLFLFELVGSLTEDGPRDLLTTVDQPDETAEIPSGSSLIAVAVPVMAVLLGTGALLLLLRQWRSGSGRRRPLVFLGAVAAMLLGLGIYLSAAAISSGSLPFGGVDYSAHPVNTQYVTPLGLTIMAAFIVTVGLVAVTRPRLLPVPLLAWLAAAIVFGMFGSAALYGVNLFHHHSTVEATTDFTGAVNVHLRSDIRLPGQTTQLGQSEPSELREGPVDEDGPRSPQEYAAVLERGSPEEKAEALSDLAETGDPAAAPLVAQELGDNNEDVSNAAELALIQLLQNGDPAVRDAIELALEEIDGYLMPLENGGYIIFLVDHSLWGPGTTAGGELVPDVERVFAVTGESPVGYLRTDVGDIYTGQGWSSLDPVGLDYTASTPARQLVYAAFIEDGAVDILSRTDPGAALLSWPVSAPEEAASRRVTVSSSEPGWKVPAGTVPVTIGVDFIEADGSYRPFSSTFSTDVKLDEYSWASRQHLVGEEVLLGAIARSHAAAQALPDSVPERVRALAEDITGEYDSVYEKAQALAWHLRENYEYTFGSEDGEDLPSGRDAVDWFLFETGEGAAGEFSSAFVVLARSVGIPARVASGWVVSEKLEQQTVYTNHAHQWAEVAFEGIGWQRFEPTPYNGAPFRANVHEAWADERDRLSNKLLAGVDAEQLLGAIDELLDYSRRAPDELQDVSEPLIKALGNDRAWEVRAKAANTLGDEGYRNAIDALVTALHEDEREEVRIAAARALAKLAGEEAVDALIKALEGDESPLVREAAIDGLVTLGGSTALDTIRGALADPSPEIRAKAADTLGNEGYQEATDDLIATLHQDDVEAVRAAAARAIAKLAGEKAVAALITALGEDDSPLVRILAVDGLADLGDPKAIEPLMGALSDPDAEVRKVVAEALERFEVQVNESETGGFVASGGGFGTSFGVGMGAFQAQKPPKIPVFRVTGAGNTNYLRTSAGDVYDKEGWRQLDPVDVAIGVGGNFRAASNEKLAEWKTAGDRPAPPSWDRVRFTPQALLENSITVRPYESESQFTAGIRPVSRTMINVSEDGLYRPYSETFRGSGPTESITWTAESRVFRIDDLTGAGAYADSQYVALPEGLPGRIGELARTITEGESGVYARAKAIEEYLVTNYSYAFYELGGPRPPQGQDPVDWFLFNHLEGTCGVFSSAFVVLARSVGIPARVVSGWAIGQTDDEQIVYLGQAHQWAEVALDGIGWVTFDPTPEGGPPSRTEGFYPSEYEEDDSGEIDEPEGDEVEDEPSIPESGLQDTTERIDDALNILDEDAGSGTFQLQNILGDTRTGYREAALEILKERGASITELENGALLVTFKNQGYSIPGTSTAQISGLPRNPIFQVHGAGHTNYLRATTGDVYENGKWRALYLAGVWVYPNQNLPEAVSAEIEEPDGAFSGLPPERLEPSLLAGFQTAPATTHTDVVRMTPVGSLGNFPDGPLPTSLHVQTIDTLAYVRPHNVVVASSEPVPEYTWLSKIPVYSEDQLRRAVVSSDSTYTQLPPTVPDRVRQRASEVTLGYDSPYEKAKALEQYLSTTFTYRFADSPDDAPPAGRDPVDWFLFDHQEGTCAVFNTAFAVMARSIGIPARVVSGWAIVAQPGTQTVYTNQAHQWSEVPFQELGWITFDATGSADGPLARAVEASGDLVHSPGEPIRLDTVTEIDRWPQQVRLGVPFNIGGSVDTLSGAPVDGMTVELFINERKENGGWPLGRGTTDAGRFNIEVTVPVSFEEGSYQLIAHAIGNDEYIGSWSDPETGVYSGTEILFSGPTEISVDEEGAFQGRLTEEAGDPLDGRSLRVSIQDQASFRVTTDDQGAFSFSRTFSRTGVHSVTVTFDQQDYMLGNEAHLTVMVTMPTELSIGAVDSLLVGEEYVIRGALRDARGRGVVDKQVDVTLPETVLRSVQTDRSGEFTVTGVAEEPGRYGIRASFAGDGVLEPSKSGFTLTVVEPSYLEISGDKEVRLGEGYVIRGALSDGEDAPLALKQIAITLADGTTVSELTDEQGSFEIRGVAERAGRYDIEASFPGDGTFQRSGGGYSLRVFEPVYLELGGDREVPVGEEYVIRGSMQDVKGAPLAAREVLVTLPEEGETAVITDATGEFEVNGTTDRPGRYAVEASFAGDELLDPAKDGYVLRVVEPVLLQLMGEKVVPLGETYRLHGTLSTAAGDGLPGRQLTVTAAQGQPVEVETGPLGTFVWETTFEEEGEATLRVKFAGTDELDSILASLTTTVGRAEIVVEQPEPVTRGEMVVLRGGLVISGQGVPDARIEVNGNQSGQTNIAGAFLVRVPVPEDASLGEMDLGVSAPALEVESSVAVRVMSETSLVVTPVEKVKAGRPALIEARVLDDHGVGIPGVAVHYGGEAPALTDDLGVALLTVDIPDQEGLTSVPVKVSYQGDAANLPATYLASLPIQVGGGQNWLVWALIPLVLLLGTGGGYLASRRLDLPVLSSRRLGLQRILAYARAAKAKSAVADRPALEEQPLEASRLEIVFVKPSPEAANAWQVGDKVEARCRLTDGSGSAIAGSIVRVVWGDQESETEQLTDRDGRCSTSWIGEREGTYRIRAEFGGAELHWPAEASEVFELRVLVPTRLEVSVATPAEDLPGIWGIGETVRVTLALIDDAGRGLAGQPVTVVVGDPNEPEEMLTDDLGQIEWVWTGTGLGVFQIEAKFEGDDAHLPSDGHGQFEVVDFRDYVVQRYNAFLVQVRQRAQGISEKATPREVEALVIRSGISVDQRALEELIARFEEADYSEHAIGRRQFEAAYRAWNRLHES